MAIGSSKEAEWHWNDGGSRASSWDEVHERYSGSDEARMAELNKLIAEENERVCRYCHSPLAQWNTSGYCRRRPCNKAELQRRRIAGICISSYGCGAGAVPGKSRCEEHQLKQREYEKRTKNKGTP